MIVINSHLTTNREITPHKLLKQYIAGERDFRRIILYDKIFRWADLREIDLGGANLGLSILEGSDLARANLTGANLSKTDLTAVDLTGANLTEANLSKAKLQKANLVGANLTGANLTGVNLRGANLTGAIMPDGTIYSKDQSAKSIVGQYIRIFASGSWLISSLFKIKFNVEMGNGERGTGCFWRRQYGKMPLIHQILNN